MVETKGWKLFQALLEAHITQEGSMLLEPSAGLDGMVQTEFRKGHLRGLVLAKDIVGKVLASIPARANGGGEASPGGQGEDHA
jgi:hypothetical protein